MCSLRCVGDCVRTINNTSAEDELRCFSPLLVRKKAGGWEKRRRLNVEGRGGKKRGSLLLPLPFFVFRFSRPLFPPFSPVARRFYVRQKVGFSSAGVCALVSIRFMESLRSL